MATLGGLIHNFTITETFKYKKKYTLYKITSLVFPAYLPETLSKINTWKRFNDIRKLHNEISKKIRDLNLKYHPPKLYSENSYFKRFDPEIIEERKKSILEFLYFVADYPVLYQSDPFVRFFESGHITPYSSPSHKCKDSENIIQPEIIEIERENSILEASIISTSSSFDFENQEAQSDNFSVQNDVNSIVESEISSIHQSEDNLDYLYEAAIDFSSAVMQEANCKYKEAFERYKLGIDKLLTGAKNDTDEYRKRIAKQKAGKYLERAEQLYETHILSQDETDFIFGAIETEPNSENTELCNIKNLERPMNQLSRYKVIKILDYVMQIQDITDKKCYAMKTIWKHSPNRLIFLPQNVLYMVPLVGYYQSDDAIYLLLHLASGGKLWNYIKNYRVNKCKTNLNDIFVEPSDRSRSNLGANSIVIPKKIVVENKQSADSGFIEVAEDCKNFDFERKQAVEIDLEEILCDYDNIIPSFDTLSKDMDVNDLVNCSQQLLNSVSNTLLKSKTRATAENDASSAATGDSNPKEIPLNKTDIPSSTNTAFVETKEKEIPAESISPIVVEIDGENYLPEESIKQWARELVVAVHNLHQVDIICGDLNINNLLLGSRGELLLTYFYQNDRNHERFMFDLDPSAIKEFYVAPEFPYLTKSSDWYSVGVILYEMLTRKKFVAFHPNGIFQYFEIQYPDVYISNEAKDLLEGLLTPADFRLNYDLIVSHPFFHNTNWSEIERNGVIRI